MEGDSAGGSAKQARDREFQAIMPLRGKILNTWEVDGSEVLASQEVHDIAVAIGIDPGSSDLSGLRYGKICILADADVDGSHIQVLLLTLFFRHFPQLVDRGHIFVARPPLFRVDVAAQGKRPARRLYCLDEDELDAMLEKLKDEGVKESACDTARFKGLGEMSPEQLWETTMNPDTRRLLRIGLGELAAERTAATMTMLMGRAESQARRAWLEEHGHEVEADV